MMTGEGEAGEVMQRTQLTNSVNTLLIEIVGSAAHPLAPDMAEWLGASKRFRAFAEAYRDKIRKKVRNTHDPEGLRDVRCELAVAYRLLEEPRFSVLYEPHGTGKQRAPDFTVLYRDHLPFHLEVTRRRARPGDSSMAPDGTGGEDARLAGALFAKLGQMQPGAINVLAVSTDGEPLAVDDVVATTRSLLLRAAGKEEAVFARHGFTGSRDFLHHYQRLSAVLLLSNDRTGDGREGVALQRGDALRGADTHAPVWVNNQARHPIPGAILTILRRLAT